MSLSAIKKALRYVVGWGTVIFFIGLLTLIFSFLGSFFCAGLAGMMVGSVKFSRSQTIALSLVAPSVLFGILRFGRTELLPGQIALLSGLSLGIFWLTYVVVRWVVWYEHKSKPANVGSRVGSSAAATNGQTLQKIPAAASGELSLQILQGHWACANGKVTREQKLMVIDDERLLVKVSDSFGKVSFFGQGQVNLLNHKGSPCLTISSVILDSPSDTLVSI